MKRAGGLGYMQAEERDRNTHTEVAVGGGPTQGDQGACYEENVCGGQGFDDTHAEQDKGYPQKMGHRDTPNRGKRVGEVRLPYMDRPARERG